jgi:hypothetical protein
MQRKKNFILLVIFLILLGWTAVYINLEQKQEGLSIDELKFSVTDTASIDQIIITGNEFTNILSKASGYWKVNDTYSLDPSMHKVLMSVLNQVRVKRTVPKTELQKISEDILNNGFKIEIKSSPAPDRVFYAGGNGISLSYFMGEDGVPYIVHLPGYESYVTGIFEVAENDWRDRLIFKTSWLGIKTLDLSYPGNANNNISVKAENNLYTVAGITELDTAGLMGFLDKISYFYTDQFIDAGQVEAYDSLKETKPFAILLVNSLGMVEPVGIRFYSQLPDDNVMLGVLNDGQMCLFSSSRIRPIFIGKENLVAR